MQINEFDDVMGVIPTEDIVEGRFVMLTNHGFTYDFGSREDVVGVKLPDTADESARCKFILTWAVSNVPTPFIVPHPDFEGAGHGFGVQRGGWDQAANSPVTGSTIFLTYPGYTDCQTIPSGTPSLVYTEGTFTLPYGCYNMDNIAIATPGSAITICNTAEDGAAEAGKPKYSATKTASVIGYTERFDWSTYALTIKVV